MKKITPNGQLIKELREQLETGALQKEMAHAVGMSERSFRSVENSNAAITVPQLDRIARYLKVNRDQIAYAIDTPKLVPAVNTVTTDWLAELRKDKIIPRFDKDIAYATMDEGQLLKDAQGSHDLTVQIEVQLSDETSGYVEELVSILTPLTRSKRDWQTETDAAGEIAMRRRMRQLLILLKGNDVWLYTTQHMRHLPERFDLAPPGQPLDIKFRLAMLFGPPGEYGEVSMHIDVDNGQPWLLKGRGELKSEGEEAC